MSRYRSAVDRQARLLCATVNGIVLLSLWALGCGARPASAALTPVQVTGENWRLTFQVSGGFAGLNRELELTSAGTATAIDRRSRRQVTRQLSRDELQEIDRLVASAVSVDLPNRTSCRDCLQYQIDLRGPRRQVTIRANDTSLADSGNGPFLTALNRLQERLLSEP